MPEGWRVTFSCGRSSSPRLYESSHLSESRAERRRSKKNAKVTVETVETVGAAAPYAAADWVTSCDRYCRTANQRSLICEEDVIQICHLLSRNGKLSLVRLTKSFPMIPNLRGIANANQNDERFKMWSVMLLCTIRVQQRRQAIDATTRKHHPNVFLVKIQHRRAHHTRISHHSRFANRIKKILLHGDLGHTQSVLGR